MSETLEAVLRASVRTLAAAAGLSPSRMHQLGKLTVLQTLPRSTVTSANATHSVALRAYLAWDPASRPLGPANDLPPTQRQGDWSGCPIHRGLSAWEVGGAARLPRADSVTWGILMVCA